MVRAMLCHGLMIVLFGWQILISFIRYSLLVEKLIMPIMIHLEEPDL